MTESWYRKLRRWVHRTRWLVACWVHGNHLGHWHYLTDSGRCTRCDRVPFGWRYRKAKADLEYEQERTCGACQSRSVCLGRGTCARTEYPLPNQVPRRRTA